MTRANVLVRSKAEVAEVVVTVHPPAVKQMFLKGRSWVVGLDGPSRVSAALCAAPLIVLMATSGPNSADYQVDYSTIEVVIQWFVAVPALLIMTPLVGAAQFGILWFVCHSSARWLQWALCVASALLLIPFQRFLATTNLTANSTAPLAAVFYPIYLALLSLPVAWLTWWLARRSGRHSKSE